MDTNWRKNYLRYKSLFLNVLAHYKERSDWKAYLEILLSLATVIIFSIFALKPTILTIAELLKQIEEKKATLTLMDEKIKNISSAQTLYDQQRNKIQLLQRFVIPKNPNVDILARQIEGLSSKYSIELNNISFGKASLSGIFMGEQDKTGDVDLFVMPNDINTMTFLIVFESSIDNLENLLALVEDFENLRIALKIDRTEFAIVQKTGGENPENMTLTLSGRMPYMSEYKPITQTEEQ